MSKKGKNTRESLMDEAQTIILDKGFGSTTIDEIIKRAGVSKGAFFHHFSSKADLGHELVKRYARVDIEHLEHTLDRAEELSEDPLQQLLIFVKLFEQELQSLTEPFPGCLFASYLYQSGLFEETVLEIIHKWMLKWRSRVMEKLEAVVQKYPPSNKVDLESLADMLLVIFEGAFVLGQSLKNTQIIANQLSHYHTYLSLLFEPER